MLSDEIRTYALRLAVVEPPSLAAADLAGPGKPNVNSSPPPAMALVFRKSRRDARPISPAAGTVAAADWSGELGERRRRDTVFYIAFLAGTEPKSAAAACLMASRMRRYVPLVKAHDTAYFCRSEHVGIRLRNNFHGAGSDEVSYGVGPYTLALSQPPCQKRSAKITPRNATSPHRANQMPIKL